MEVTGHDLAAVYALLSRIFLKEADAELMDELARPEIADVLEALEPGFGAFVRAPWDESRLEDEAAEYARLFLLPRGVPPYATAWRGGDEGAVRADLEEKIAVLHDVLRVRPADFGLGNVPSDHVGMLLALTSVALQVDTSGALAVKCADLTGDWVPRFAERVAAETTSPLYRAAARLTNSVLVSS